MSDKLRILIVDDDQRMARTLADIFNVKGLRAEAVHSGSEALEKVRAGSGQTEGQFDCILTDIKMPEMSGVELQSAIKAIQPDLPVVFMTAYAADKLVKEGLEQGAIASLAKPLDINLLLGFFYSLRKERAVVIIDDDPRFRKTLHDILQLRGFEVVEIADPTEILQALSPDGQVVLLDMKLNGVTGLDILKEIRQYYPHLPVVLVTGYRQEMVSAIETGLRISAYTCLYKPFEVEKLLEILTEIRHQELGRFLGQPVRKRK